LFWSDARQHTHHPPLPANLSHVLPTRNQLVL
jgi:hypothetical protein